MPVDTSSTIWEIFPADVGIDLHPGGWVFIDHITFLNYTNPEHRVFFTDTRESERGVFDVRGAEDFSPITIPFCGKPVWGLRLHQLDSGLVQVHLSTS